MNNPYTIEKVVLEILKANEEARNDDMKLYLLVCEAVNPFPTCDRDIGSFSFSSVMNHYRELRLPHFESVRRSRAKIQAEIPELAGDRSCRQRKKELEILTLLASHPGRIYSREEMINELWEDAPYVLDRTVDVHIARIRSKLGVCKGYLTNRSGYGYSMNAEE